MFLRTACIAIGIFWAGLAWPSTITPFAEDFVAGCIDQTGNVQTNPSCNAVLASSLIGGPTSFSSTLTAPGSSLAMNGSAAAGFGDLHTEISTTLNVAGTKMTTAYAVAEAVVTDVITVNFASLTGEEGLMLLDYTLDGTTSASGQDNAFAEVAVSAGTSLQQNAKAVAYTGAVNGVFAVGQAFTFIYGQPFGLQFALAGCGKTNPAGRTAVWSTEIAPKWAINESAAWMLVCPEARSGLSGHTSPYAFAA
jgi:hypothetical protein